MLKMVKIQKFLFLLVFILLSVSVFGFSFSRSLGGVGEWITKGGGEFLAYANNDANTEDYNYSTCTISKSVFPALIQDINADTVPDIIVFPDENTVEIYSSSCEYIGGFTVPYNEGIQDQPVITDWDDDGFYELTFLTETLLYYAEIYPYELYVDGSPLEYELQYSNYTYYTGETDLIYLACTDNHQPETYYNRCFFFKENSRDVFLWDYDTLLFYEYADELTNNTMLFDGTRKPVGSKTPVNYYLPHCFQNYQATALKINCDLLNVSGRVIKSAQLDYGTGSSNPNNITTVIGRIDNNFRILVQAESVDNTLFMLDLNLVTIAKFDGSLTTNIISKPFIGDIDKDGSNEGCSMYYGNPPTILCFTSSSKSTYETGTGFSPSIPTAIASTPLRSDIIIGDFDSDSGLMTIVNGWGMFTSDNSSFASSTWNMSNNHTINVGLEWGITASSTPYNQGYGTPMYVGGSSTSTYVVVNNDLSATCGDGVCAITENIFTCPDDCEYTPVTDDTCFDDDDCPPNFPKCIAERCVYGYNESLICSKSTDCPYDFPICYNGYCIKNVYGTIPSDNIDNQTSISLEQKEQLDEFLDAFTGAHPLFRFIFGIVIIILILLAVSQGLATLNLNSGSEIILIFFMYIGAIINTLLNLWPTYVLILLTLVLISIGILSYRRGASVGV